MTNINLTSHRFDSAGIKTPDMKPVLLPILVLVLIQALDKQGEQFLFSSLIFTGLRSGFTVGSFTRTPEMFPRTHTRDLHCVFTRHGGRVGRAWASRPGDREFGFWSNRTNGFKFYTCRSLSWRLALLG